MKKNYLKFICFLFVFGVLNINAQSIHKKVFFENNPDLGGDVTISSSSVRIVNNESYVDFEVESDENGAFYADFWLAPSKLSDNTYTTYKVYVNEKFAGTITPTSGNWQSISLTGNKKLNINKGGNTISVVTSLPEITSVEFVKLGKAKEKSKIYSEYYENFYAKAKANNEKSAVAVKNVSFGVTALNEQDSTSLLTFRSAGYQTTTAYVNYTFYIITYIQAGITYNFRSESTIRHYLEAFSETPSVYASTVMTMSPNSSGKYVNTISVTAPQSGYYYIKTRSYRQLESGLVTLTTTGNRFYNDMPLYSYGFAVAQGGDNNYYGSFTKNPSPTDPFIFIQESITNKIVAHNDDYDKTDSHAYKYGLTKLDSYVRSRYANPTSAVLVSSSESYCTPGTCTLYARVLDSDNVPRSLLYSTEGNGATNNDNLFSSEAYIYPNPATINSSIVINSEKIIKQIDIYDLSGRMICTKKMNIDSVNVSLSELNINSTGMYIINIHSDKGVKSHKLIVK